MVQNIASRRSGARDAPDAVAQVRAYHRLTKHMPGRYAPGPGYMDWANQPDPFRASQAPEISSCRWFSTTARRHTTHRSIPGTRRPGR